MPMPDINDETNEGQIGDTVVVLHRYVLKRGNTQVGPCLKACAWEKDWTVGLTVPEPDDWEVKGCECQTDSAFCFLAPYVYDKKIYIIPATFQGIPWNDVPDGTVLDEFFHRVKVDVPNCDGSFSEVKSPKMLMQLIKVSDTKVRFNLVNN